MAKPIINKIELVEKTGAVKGLSNYKSWIKPVEAYVSSSFGKRINPVRGKEEFHNGIDLATERGTPALAIASGTVEQTGNSPSWGKFLRYKIDDTHTIFYAHLSDILVREGEKVKQGQTMAKTGNTGLSTGAHLHMTIYDGDTEIDPLPFFDYSTSTGAKAEYVARGQTPPTH